VHFQVTGSEVRRDDKKAVNKSSCGRALVCMKQPAATAQYVEGHVDDVS
jgi:hypothetical protein